MDFLVYLLILVIIFHYLLYPMGLFILSSLKKNERKNLGFRPPVSMIVAAYNEEKVIREKIKNMSQLNYPKDKMQLIIVSDGSSDLTSLIVQEYLQDGVILLHKSERNGKTAALNRAVPFATGDIIIFSDANSFFDSNAIINLVECFNSPRVGAVCGRKEIIKNYGVRIASLGDKSYWGLESKIKTWQSNLGGITNADGEIFALKKSLYPNVDSKMINDDQVITFELVKRGHRISYCPSAVTYEEASITMKDDFNVKKRMIFGALQAISHYPWVINPIHSWFSFNFFIHKFFRYSMFILLTFLLSASIISTFMGNLIASLVCLGFLILFLMGLVGLTLVRHKKVISIFYIPYYYLIMNFACFKGFQKYWEGSSLNNLWVKAVR